MTALKLSPKAKVAIEEKHEDKFLHFWSPLANELIGDSHYLCEKYDLSDLFEIIDLVIPRFIEYLANDPLLRHVDIRSLYYHEYEFTDSALNRKAKVYNLAEAAKEMMVSEKFLRKGLQIGFFSGKKIKGRWRIDEIDLGNNWHLLPYLS